jgi:hypothetical protein
LSGSQRDFFSNGVPLADAICDLFAYRGEESLEGFDGSLLPDPKQACNAEIDLIDQREVLVPFGDAPVPT